MTTGGDYWLTADTERLEEVRNEGLWWWRGGDRMRLIAIASSTIAVALAIVVAVLLWRQAPSESAHDRDLRDCRERYGVSSRYAESDVRAYQASMVDACMRGRGY